MLHSCWLFLVHIFLIIIWHHLCISHQLEQRLWAPLSFLATLYHEYSHSNSTDHSCNFFGSIFTLMFLSFWISCYQFLTVREHFQSLILILLLDGRLPLHSMHPSSSKFPSCFFLYKCQGNHYDFLLYKPPLMVTHFPLYFFAFHSTVDDYSK